MLFEKYAGLLEGQFSRKFDSVGYAEFLLFVGLKLQNLAYPRRRPSSHASYDAVRKGFCTCSRMVEPVRTRGYCKVCYQNFLGRNYS